MIYAIPFPDISPILVEIPLGFTSLPIRWYALAYIVGIYLGYLMARSAVQKPHLWKNDEPLITRQQLDDLLFWVIVGVIVGGRLGYVIFYGQGTYWSDPVSILRVWDGGMSFHGGFLGVILVSIIHSIKWRVSILSLLDLLALGTPIGILLGRLANFINAELWGRPTDVAWGVIFPGDRAQNCPGVEGLCARHPSQLYEAGLEGLLLGLALFVLVYGPKWFKTPGAIGGMFVGGYGLGRFIVEYFREADAQFVSPDNPLGHVFFIGPLGLSQGQLLSFPMILVGFATILIVRSRKSA